MRFPTVARAILALALVLIAATPALANSLASWVLVWPGVVTIDPLFGILPTVLVSFIERPFVSRAGIQDAPLVRSLRANLLSLLAGLVLTPSVYAFQSMQGLILLAVVAVSITIVVEIFYLELAIGKESRQLRWRWIIVGNIVSNCVLVGIALTVRWFQINHPRFVNQLAPYQGPLMLAQGGISLTAVIGAIFGPAIRRLLTRPAAPHDGMQPP